MANEYKGFSLTYVASHPSLRADALEAIDNDDLPRLFSLINNHEELHFVSDNCLPLLERGLYERALLNAYEDTNLNFSAWNPRDIDSLFDLADPDILKAIAPPPRGSTFTVYRGVGGEGKSRRERGFSWSASPFVASWFAIRYDLQDPAVFKATIDRDSVVAYLNERNEEEFLAYPSSCERMDWSIEEIKELAAKKGSE